MIERRALTAALVTAIGTGTSMPVGLANSPINGGWDGQPNADGSNFTPYSVITPQTATNATGPMNDPQADRQIPYAVSCFGVMPEQTEWMADKARAAAEALKKTTVALGDGNYRIQQVRTDVIGGLQRVDVSEPPYWGQTDVMTLWLTRD